ncbi:MAG TPA: hypothetical protein VMU26_09845 [Candidatus Polarisedimenticolia bacterium]|nr:hypothetical protein [Candidatus Polarisedimenticolia bacterium]
MSVHVKSGQYSSLYGNLTGTRIFALIAAVTDEREFVALGLTLRKRTLHTYADFESMQDKKDISSRPASGTGERT